ncbi:MAG: hypothetical protein ACTSVU_05875 [Promethearchaeota archaeon]
MLLIRIDFEIAPIIYFIIALVSILPIIAFYLAYKRIRDKGLLYTLFAFIFFFIKAIVLSSELFFNNFEDDVSLVIAGILDLFIIILIAYPLFRRLKINSSSNSE